MNKRGIIKYLIIVLFIIVGAGVYHTYQEPKVKITDKNVKLIWCTAWNKDGERKLQVDDSDKKVILSEISELKKSDLKGEIGTIGYVFTIQLMDGSEYSLYENTSETVTLRKEGASINIKAPKTVIFINRFISENNIER